jgi:hypothetical protein
MSRSGIEQMLYMMDNAFDANGAYEAGHWHALLVNLRACREEDWTWLPEDGRRPIFEMAIHVGACKYVYGSHLSGNGEMHWDKAGTIPRLENVTGPAEVMGYLQSAQSYLRNCVCELADDGDLLKPRLTPQGWQREARWLIKTMIEHDLYHGGEINHLRALAQKNDD